ncbi:hypothetical protein [Thiolapillus sp.]|nr:hypothetical protein [Thiolapillus sp.]
MLELTQISEIRHFNHEFLTLIRSNPQDPALSFDGIFNTTRIVQAINSLPQDGIAKLVRPSASLFFNATVGEEPLNGAHHDWVSDYWSMISSLSRQTPIDQFAVLTGLSASQYLTVRDTPIHEVTHWAARTVFGIRFPARLWAVLSNHAVAPRLDPEMAPLIAAYAAAAGLSRYNDQHRRVAA